MEHDHAEHHRMMIRDFRRRFYVSLVATIPVLALSATVQSLLGVRFSVPGGSWIVLAISSGIYFYGGWPFLTGMRDELAKKTPGMMTLIALAITVAYAYSSAVVIGLEGRTFFWELATLIDVMLAGHWIEMRSVLSASSALEELARLMPDTAHRKRADSAEGDSVEDVPLSEVAEGDVLVIKPGEKIPADGVIRQGSSHIDESMLTGESRPVAKGEGDELIGGSVNGNGSLELEVRGTGEDSYLAKVIDMVQEAQGAKSRTQNLSDRAALWLTVTAITVGIATLAAWLLAGRDLQFSIARMATVMVITCPHALGLAIPLVASVSTARAAGHGLLIRNRTAFENARRITTVVFDKTGTLTEGTFEVQDITVHEDDWDEERLLAYAAAVEAQSEHPIAAGITRRAREREVEVPEAKDVEAIKGQGVRGTVDGQEVKVVSPGYLEKKGIERPTREGGGPARDESGPTHDEGGPAGATRVHMLVGDQLVGSFALADRLRDTAKGAVQALKDRGIHCWMLTGDNEATAREVAEQLSLDGYFAEVLPDQKQEKIKELQAKGEYVAMTGDGVNDAPALAQAEIGIAVGSGTDVAAASSDIVLVESDPADITALILFGRATYRKMIQNLIWATGYNVVAIPLAAGVFYSAGILLSPAVGALLMSLSTVIVAVNARLLRVPEEAAG